MEAVVRLLIVVLSLGIAAFALVRSSFKSGPDRWAMVTLATYAAAVSFVELSVLPTNHPITYRSIALLVPCLVGCVYVVKKIRAGRR